MRKEGTPAGVILAGGLGTRLRSVVGETPKPLVPVAGRPFLDWVLDYLRGQGVSRVAISAGYRAEQFSQFCDEKKGRNEVTSFAEPFQMGTAGGFLFVREKLVPRPKAWLVMNGDSLALTSLDGLFQSLESAGAALLAVWMEEADRYGTLECNGAKRLLSFQEKRSGSGWINAGVYLFREEILKDLPESRPLSFEKDIFPLLLSRGVEIRVEQVVAPFLDIGTPESLGQAEVFVRENKKWFSREKLG